MSAPRRQAGFTLVELVTCIVILGVLAVVAGPRLIERSNFDARNYSNEVAAAARQAQLIAVASGCEVAIAFNSNNYIAQQRAAVGNQCNPAGAWTVTVQRADGTALSGTAPAGVTLTPVTRVVFGAQGQVNNGVPPTMNIGPYRLRIDARSGFVSLQ